MCYLSFTNILSSVDVRRETGTLATRLGYGTGNPRFFVSGRFTSLVNCGELVNPLNSLGELDVLT